MTFYTYDLETYPNYFSFAGKFRGEERIYYFEISDRTNDRHLLLEHLAYLSKYPDLFMVGYNSLNFDYPIIHELMDNPYTFTAKTAYDAAQRIIGSDNGYGVDRVRLSDRRIAQIDLVKVHHFDNENRRTPLKSLQCAMRAKTVVDLPYAPGTFLTPEQMEEFKIYNIHDVTETERFLERSMEKILMRKELLESGTLRGDVYNFSDVRIGSELLISRIGRTKCFQGSKPRQTFRESVCFNDIVFPSVKFATEPFHEVLEGFKKTTIKTREKNDFKIRTNLAGVDFHFGVGGLHASVDSQVFRSDDKYVIRDVDVAGMYPSIAAVNGLFPQHLGQEFVRAYAQIIADRKNYPKGSTFNKAFKLAGNGVFGLSDSYYTCFYDPRFPKQITINGQLQLLQLVEQLMFVPGLQIIQANTDGTTVYYPRQYDWLFNEMCKSWEYLTKLTLEHVEYQTMWIRDVNNYMAKDVTGKMKRKGAYWFPETDADYDDVWNKDFSQLVVQKTASLVMEKGWHPLATLYNHFDPFDFMLRYRATGDSKLLIDGKPSQKTLRYYISTDGGQLIKHTPVKPHQIGKFKRKPGITDKLYASVMSEVGEKWDARIHTKSKSKYEDAYTDLAKGFKVSECNDSSDFNWSKVDFNYYLKEVEKLVIEENKR